MTTVGECVSCDHSFLEDILGFDFGSESNDDTGPNLPENERQDKFTHVIINRPQTGLRSERICTLSKPAIKLKSKKRRETRHLVKSQNALDTIRAPNMSRRVRGLTLCAFPTFDKCDSLVFFPISLVKCLNSDDFTTLKRLLSVHLHKNCEINFKGALISVKKYLQTVEVLSGLHPDKMSCVHDTKVIDDSIHAVVYTKFTDIVSIFDSIARVNSAEFPFAFPSISRAERWKNILSSREEPVTDEELSQIYELAGSGKDIVVYGYIKYCLKFDYVSRKVVRLDYNFNLTSAQPLTNAFDKNEFI